MLCLYFPRAANMQPRQRSVLLPVAGSRLGPRRGINGLPPFAALCRPGHRIQIPALNNDGDSRAGAKFSPRAYGSQHQYCYPVKIQYTEVAKKLKASGASVLIGQATLDLRKDLFATWKKVTAAGEVAPESFREFFKPFIRYAETLLKIEVEKLSRLPLQAVQAKMNGFWPDGRAEGNDLRLDVLTRIAPQPPFPALMKALPRLMDLRLSNEHCFDESRRNLPIPAAFLKAAADAGIENDSNIFETLRSLPQRYLGDWFLHLFETWRLFRTPSSGASADICRGFSLVMLDYPVWNEFFDKAFSALSIRADNLLNEQGLRELELRAKPRRGNLDDRANARGKRDPAILKIQQKVRELREQGCDYKSICERLGTFERPPRATWRELSWPVAYKKHTSSVTKWLSLACSGAHS
jgi:hypothetical protein